MYVLHIWRKWNNGDILVKEKIKLGFPKTWYIYCRCVCTSYIIILLHAQLACTLLYPIPKSFSVSSETPSPMFLQSEWKKKLEGKPCLKQQSWLCNIKHFVLKLSLLVLPTYAYEWKSLSATLPTATASSFTKTMTTTVFLNNNTGMKGWNI